MTNEEKARVLSCVNYLTKEEELLGPPEDVKIRINSYWVARKMGEWKDKQFKEEKKKLLGLVELLPVNETNQTIIEDLKGLLK